MARITMPKIIHLGSFLFFAFIILISNLVEAFDFDSDYRREKSATPIVQDLKALENSDGKIVDKRKISIKSKWSDEVECYRIKYLSDGLKVVGYILRPKGGNTKFPVMIYNRGGNREFGKINNKTLKYLSYLSSNNYVVIATQYRGNDGGEGREEFGGKDVNDILNLIPLAKSLPYVDPEKIVMLGSSRGGMMTYLAIKEGVGIKAAAVVGGVTDLIQWDQEREGIGEKVLEELIWPSNKKEYKKRSAYYWPDKIDVPVLILRGDDDWRVNVSQAKKLSEKLDLHSKEYDLVIFPKGDHGLSTHSSERNRMIFEWFDKYLQ